MTIIDYGVGNLSSIMNMLKKIGKRATISSDKTEILHSEKLLLPGVGAFDTCVQKLQASGLIDTLNKKVLEEKTPILGICVGSQLLTSGSEEGTLPGLGWIAGKVVRFRDTGEGLKIPHMGWSEIRMNKQSKLFSDMPEDRRFYFVHSYHLKPEDEHDVAAFAHYGYDFPAAVEKDNIMGVQFHPEKSHKFGMQLLQNFSNL